MCDWGFRLMNVHCVFQVQHAQQKSENALVTLNRAIAADPKNPLCKFHRASILFANDRHKVRLGREVGEICHLVPTGYSCG